MERPALRYQRRYGSGGNLVMEITKKELIDALEKIASNNSDPEKDHGDADDLLLNFINDKKVKIAFNKIHKWYA